MEAGEEGGLLSCADAGRLCTQWDRDELNISFRTTKFPREDMIPQLSAHGNIGTI